MDFIDQLKQFGKRVESMVESIQTEEATKTSIIMPFFSLLGYDVFNPYEFVPEYTADVGIKKGEKVDYAIMRDEAPAILIEAKWVGENLDNHDSQLFRYFGTTHAKFAILTNGIIYKFFTDLDEPNKMDTTPFLEINILNIKESQIPELKKFCKPNFDVDEIFNAASELKYSNEFRRMLASELQNPSDDFVRFFLASSYTGRMTQQILEKFRPVVKKSLNNYISELMNDKIKAALSAEKEETEVSRDDMDSENGPSETDDKKAPHVVTTNEELEAYFLIKTILKQKVPVEDITYKDTERYMNVLYKGNIRNWVCRLVLTESRKYILIPDENKKPVRIDLTSIYDLEKYEEELLTALKRYTE